ncbi:cytochrome c oxidase assembly protein COX11-like protein, partial [Dinothrombium tinctorium]
NLSSFRALNHSFSSRTHFRTLHCLNAIKDNALIVCTRKPTNAVLFRCFSQSERKRNRNRDLALYGTAFAIFTFAVSYAAVPLYRIYCQSTGKGGRATLDADEDKVAKMQPVKDRLITVRFSADVSSQLAWNFKPTQIEVKVPVGETVLAFYTARNPLQSPIIGVATYNVIPFEAGQYLHKIQCFCFEEQRLNPNEEVDMPVFFYLDPEYATDPRLENVNTIVLSYTFFETKEGIKLPFLSSNSKAIT